MWNCLVHLVYCLVKSLTYVLKIRQVWVERRSSAQWLKHSSGHWGFLLCQSICCVSIAEIVIVPVLGNHPEGSQGGLSVNQGTLVTLF